MKTEIIAALAEAQASAKMMIDSADLEVMEWIEVPGFRAAITARHGVSPAGNFTAEKLAMDCLCAAPEKALALIAKRIAKSAALSAAPLSDGALRALAGQD